ncbi:MAG: FecR domain-containing protein [Verrucomicrobiota bacterium]
MSTPNRCFYQKITTALAALAFSCLSIFSASAQNSALEPGFITVIEAVGDAKIVTPEKPDGAPAAAGMNLRVGDTVVTTSGGRVGLAFSNGSLFEVSENTKFSVQEYLQEPWKFSIEEWQKLEHEPTRSQTKAFVEYGDLTVKVKKLDSGSAMQVSTPLGVAGIRGTTFRVRVVRNADGTPKSASVQVAEGQVNFTPQGGGESTPITPGNSVTVSVTVGPTGQIQISTPVQETLSAAEINLITQAVENLVQASNNLTTLGDTPAAQTQTGGDARPQPANNPPAPPPPPIPTPTPVPSGL